jgi:hypothetical protein
MSIQESSKDVIRRKVAEFTELCKEIDEETASRAPSDRWSPKEIVSHLCGPEGVGLLPTLSAFLEKDTPLIEIDVANPFFSEARERMTFAELMSEFEREYDHVIEFASSLTEEQLGRKAHVPILKETPIGEYPTLEEWILAIGDFHLGSHIDHMREVLHELRVSDQSKRIIPEVHELHPTIG